MDLFPDIDPDSRRMVPPKTFSSNIGRVLLLAVFPVITGLVMASCRYKEVREPAPFVHELGAGEKFRITLPENHEKKESWNMDDTYDKRVLLKLAEVWHGNDKGIDFNFQAGRAGTTTLTFFKRQYSDTLESVKYNLKITAN